MYSHVKTYKVRTKSYFYCYLVHETIDSSTSIVAFLSLKKAFQNRVRQNIKRGKGPSRVKQLFLVGFNYTQFSDSILGNDFFIDSFEEIECHLKIKLIWEPPKLVFNLQYNCS